MAFAALVDRYWEPVRAWLGGMVCPRHAAEDLVQETVLKAWWGLPRLAAEETFRVWLFRIARNEFLAQARSRRPAPHPVRDARDPHPGPSDEAEEREASDALRAAVAALPVVYRDVYLLWTQEGMPYPEIARVLGLTEETARWRVCESRRRLSTAVRRFLESDAR